MSLKKKNRTSPVNMSELVGGQQYIEMVVCRDGMMYLSHVTVLGQPFKKPESCKYNKGLWKVNCIHHTPGGGYTDKDYASSMGVDTDRLYNSHRTFRYTARNMTVLTDMVQRNALREYLEFIGESDIDMRIARMKDEADNPTQWDPSEDFDDMSDDEDATRDLDGDWINSESF